MGAGAHKPYSYIRIDKNTLRINRNQHRLNQLLAQAGLIDPALCGKDFRENDHFSLENEDFARQIREHARSVHAQVIAPLNDARRRPGIVRAKHTRRGWTAERRAKYQASIERRRQSGGNSIISEVG